MKGQFKSLMNENLKKANVNVDYFNSILLRSIKSTKVKFHCDMPSYD